MELCSKLRSLTTELGDENRELFWSQLLRPVRQFVFRHLSAPSPFDHPDSLEKVMQFKRLNGNNRSTAPGYASRLDGLEESLDILASTSDNPLGESCAKLLGTFHPGENVGLVVCRMPFKPLVHSMLQNMAEPSFGSYVVLEPGQLKGATSYDRMIVFGHQQTYRDAQYVFSAPRAKQQYLIGFEWLRPSVPVQSGFASPQNKDRLSPSFVAAPMVSGDDTRPSLEPDHGATQQFDIDALLPSIDLNTVVAGLKARPDHIDSDAEYDGEVEAKIIEFEDGRAVFLTVGTHVEDTGARKYHVIASGINGKLGIETAIIGDLEPGMFLLLRTSGGGGDYIDFVADRLLGGLAIECRATQSSWKLRLRGAVTNQGIGHVVDELSRLGCSVAGEQNVRGWITTRRIGLRRDEDFSILMEFLGLGSQFDDILNKTEAIRSAHRRAGHYIRSSLLSQISSITDAELESLVSKEFTLEGRDGGSLTAFRIREIHDTIYTVPEFQTQQPFMLE